jgi:hypothetical protein
MGETRAPYDDDNWTTGAGSKMTGAKIKETPTASHGQPHDKKKRIPVDYPSPATQEHVAFPGPLSASCRLNLFWVFPSSLPRHYYWTF